MVNLKEKRLAKGMTQEELAKSIDTVQSSIARFESGETRPKPETAKALAAVLDFEWTEFYEEEPEDDARRA